MSSGLIEQIALHPDFQTACQRYAQATGSSHAIAAAAVGVAAMPGEVFLVRDALDHIMRTARASRTQTRRSRWIVSRAEAALAGRPYVPSEHSLPPTMDTALRRANDKIARLTIERDGLLTALDRAEFFIGGFEGDDQQEGIDELLRVVREAIAQGKGAET